jgi:hypothetical protein
MSNWGRFTLGLAAAIVIVLSGEQASIDGSYISGGFRQEDQRQAYKVDSYVRTVKQLTDQAKELRDGFNSRHHQGGQGG